MPVLGPSRAKADDSPSSARTRERRSGDAALWDRPFGSPQQVSSVLEEHPTSSVPAVGTRCRSFGLGSQNVDQLAFGPEELGPPSGDQLTGIAVVRMEADLVVLEQLSGGFLGRER